MIHHNEEESAHLHTDTALNLWSQMVIDNEHAPAPNTEDHFPRFYALHLKTIGRMQPYLLDPVVAVSMATDTPWFISTILLPWRFSQEVHATIFIDSTPQPPAMDSDVVIVTEITEDGEWFTTMSGVNRVGDEFSFFTLYDMDEHVILTPEGAWEAKAALDTGAPRSDMPFDVAVSRAAGLLDTLIQGGMN